jgi:hypothetical protein
LAIQIAIDQLPELSANLEIRAAPTLIAFHAGKERERIVCTTEESRILEWLIGLANTTTPVDVSARNSSAAMMLENAKYDEALERYVWLWNNSSRLNPSWRGARLSFVAEKIEALVKVHSRARTEFTCLRNATEAVADLELRTIGPRVDWVVLNQVLEDQERTMAWFNAVKSSPDADTVIEGVAPFIIEPLKTCGRWADIGRLYRDPIAELLHAHHILLDSVAPMRDDSRPETHDVVSEAAWQEFRSIVTVLYVGLVAAGRTSDAMAIRKEALRLDPSKEMERALRRAPIPYN